MMVKTEDKSKNRLIIKFAKLWGIEIANDKNDGGVHYKLLRCDEGDLFDLFTEWADEFIKSGKNDDIIWNYFQDKLSCYLKQLSF